MNSLDCSNVLDISVLRDNYISAGEVFDDYSLLALSIDKDAIIGDISKMELTDSFIYIMDSKQSRLFVFGQDGNSINTIDNYGRGPNEYLSLDDFVVDEDHLYVLSRVSERLFVYDLLGRELLRTMELNSNIHTQFQFDSNKDIIFYNDFTSDKGEYYNLDWISKSEKKSIRRASVFSENQNNLTSTGSNNFVLHKYQDSLFYSLPFYQQIFLVDSNGVNCYLNVNFDDKYKLPKGGSEFNYDDMFEYQNLVGAEESPIWKIEGFNFGEKFLKFDYVQGGIKSNVIVNRKTDEKINGYIMEDKRIPFGLQRISVLNDNKLITYIHPESFTQYYEDEVVRNSLESKGYSLEQLRENNNPILITLTLKAGF